MEMKIAYSSGHLRFHFHNFSSISSSILVFFLVLLRSVLLYNLSLSFLGLPLSSILPSSPLVVPLASSFLHSPVMLDYRTQHFFMCVISDSKTASSTSIIALIYSHR